MYSIKPTVVFQKNTKKLLKKFPNIKNDCLDFIAQLKQGFFVGDKLKGFDEKVFKVRIGSSDQRKGKRGGFRIIYYVVTEQQEIYLLTIYAKVKQENITKKEIKTILQFLHETEKL